MESLGQHIKELLYNNDCVIVPNFGGFVANPHAASVNQLKSRIEPPFKEIGFNPRLTKNDGLLANAIKEAESISYETALNNIAAAVEEINFTVKSGKTFRLEEIGAFYLDSNQNLRFEAEKSTNFNLAFFGFEPVSVLGLKTPVQTITNETSEIPEAKETKVVPIQKTNKKWRNIAAVAACIPLLFYLLWVPFRIDHQSNQHQFQWASLNPYQELPCPTYEVRTDITPKIEIPEERKSVIEELALSNENYVSTSFFNEDNPNYNPNQLVTIELRNFPAEAVTTKVVYAFVPKSKTQRFYVVGGCFKEYTNANGMINSLRQQGFKAVLIDKKGALYRVGIEGANSKDQIVKVLDRAHSKGFTDAWVLKL